MRDELVSFFETFEHKPWSPRMTSEERERFEVFFRKKLTDIDSSKRDAFFRWIRTESDMTSVRMDVTIPYREMYEEAMRLYDWSVGHRGDSHDGWKSLCVHGLEYDKTDDARKYGYETSAGAPYKWTVAAAAAPVTKTFFRDVFPLSNYQRVRFMYLEPGGYILPHNDNPKPGLSAFNLALNNPDGCAMVTEKGLIPWKAGDLRIFDTHNQHAVWNRSDEVRVHMIAHSDDWSGRYHKLTATIIQGYLDEINK